MKNQFDKWHAVVHCNLMKLDLVAEAVPRAVGGMNFQVRKRRILMALVEVVNHL